MPSDPSVRRARLPDAYGLPKDSPTLAWESVEARFKASLHYWISTVDADGNPLARPIDGIWFDGALYFGGHDDARWRRNLRSNPRACLTLEDAESVAILEGSVDDLVPDEALAMALGDEVSAKYEWGADARDIYRGSICRFRPRAGHAWTLLFKDATRYMFSS